MSVRKNMLLYRSITTTDYVYSFFRINICINMAANGRWVILAFQIFIFYNYVLKNLLYLILSFVLLFQKGIIEKLRQELREYQKTLKVEATKNGIEEKRLNFANVLSRNRKQNM